MLFVVLAVLVVLGGLVVAVRTLPSAGRTADTTRPGTVLLVPGYGGDRNSLAPLADRIRAGGRQAEVLTLPGDGTGDLLAQVDVLDQAVRAAIDGGSPSVDVVGYSAGGVVARLWIARDDGARSARRVITLGSPLHGTQLAAAGSVLVPGACPTACQQLAPGSALLAPVETQPLPAGLPWLSVWTENDQTVTPPDSARLAGAVNVPVQQVCPDENVSHEQLPADPLVMGLVLRALGTTPLATPGPADCTVLRAAG